jgi:hypothetical protein
MKAEATKLLDRLKNPDDPDLVKSKQLKEKRFNERKVEDLIRGKGRGRCF